MDDFGPPEKSRSFHLGLPLKPAKWFFIIICLQEIKKKKSAIYLKAF